MTRLAIGGDLWTLGAIPASVLEELERGGAAGESLIAASCPDDLLASAAIDELTGGSTGGIDVQRALDRAWPTDDARAARGETAPWPSSDAVTADRLTSSPGSASTGAGSSRAAPRRSAVGIPEPRAHAAGARAGTPAAATASSSDDPLSDLRTPSALAVDSAVAGSPDASVPAGGARAGAGAARAWLAAKAARTGIADVLDRQLAISAAAGATVADATDAPIDAANRPDGLAYRPAALVDGSALPAAALDRLTEVLDRLAAPGGHAPAATHAARAAFPEIGSHARGRPRAPAGMPERMPGRIGDAIPTERPYRAPARTPEALTKASTQRSTAAWAEPSPEASPEAWSDAWSDASTGAPIDHARARAAVDAATHASTAPVVRAATRVRTVLPAPIAVEPMLPEPTSEPPLAEPPASSLRRFALMAEAAAPPPPGEVEATASLGPRRPPPALQAAALDDLELADSFTRILRREARRDGIDLDPPP